MSTDCITNRKTCNYFVNRKNRFCRMITKVGEEYCAEHLPNNLTLNSNESHLLLRIPCPLDSKHTCYKNKLEKHLKVCNAKKDVSAPYVSERINEGDPLSNDVLYFNDLLPLSDIPINQIVQLISKINKIYEDKVKGNIIDNIHKYVIVEEEINKCEYSAKKKKHLHQASSLLGLLKSYELLKPNVCYVELGAGKGQLSYWIYKAVECIGKPIILLVDKSSHRHKLDNKLDKVNGDIQRIRINIADLILYKVEAVVRSKHCVGISKHLCGDATDLALRCLTKNAEARSKLLGLAMAVCCHHRCQWISYVGKEYFNEVKLTSADFNIMVRLASWATCGNSNKSDTEALCETESHDRFKELGLDRKGREEIGRKCKYIIDWGRLMYLEQRGLKCFLHFYCTRDITLENVCIIGINHNV